MVKENTLADEMTSAEKFGTLNPSDALPEYVVENLSGRFAIRAYQKTAINRFIYLAGSYPHKTPGDPTHMLFNMATGSGKTLLMAANILYLYRRGYRNFVFFVNSATVIQKTKVNFLDKSSPKYLFADRVVFDEREVFIQEVDNFDGVNEDNINILFTTIQKLHSRMSEPRENAVTIEDFAQSKVVFLSDEAHHINAMTKNLAKMNAAEREESASWENTVNKIFQSNADNVMLEYTATIDMDNKDIYDKYKEKMIYRYTLKEFRENKFSKDPTKAIDSLIKKVLDRI